MSSRDTRLWTGVALLVVATYLLHFLPLQPQMPAASLDAAWAATFAQDYLAGAAWGRDLVFMFGPLSFLVTGAYDPLLYDATLAVRALAHGGVALALALLWRPLPRAWLWALPLLAVLPLSVGVDAQFLLLPLLAALLRASGRGAWLWPLLVMLSAVFGWAKFSFLLSAALLLPLADLVLLWRQRRWPCMTPLLLLAGLATHLAAGQPLDTLPAFLATSFEVAVGYTSAASTPGPPGWPAAWSSLERLAFLALAAALLALALWEARRAAVDSARAGAASVLRAMTLPLAGALFLLWKAGFVRHDAHALQAWTGLVLVSIALMPLVGRARPALLAIALLATAAHWISGAHQGFAGGWPRPLVGERSATQAAAGWQYLSDRDGRLATLDRARAQAWALLADRYRLPALDGRVDVVPWPGIAAVAAGLDYRPRPAPGYIASTPALRRLVVAYFTGPLRPDWVLWRQQELDRQYPLLQEAHLLPLLLTGYDWVDSAAGFLLLRHRDRARTLTETPLATLTLPPDAWVDLPAAQGPLWARLELPVTLWGHLQTALWRPPLLALGVELADGTQLSFPLPRPPAAEGFLLSPVSVDLTGLALLLRWLDDHALPPSPRRVRLSSDQAAPSLAYAWPARLQLARLEVAGAREFPLDPDSLSGVLLDELLSSYPPGSSKHPPGLQSGGRLVAFPPSRLTLKVASLLGAGRLQVGFGIVDEAWQSEAATDGACFRIEAMAGGSPTVLFERCLDPFRVAADRGPQSTVVILPERGVEALLFATDPRGNLYRDWAYWQDLRPE